MLYIKKQAVEIAQTLPDISAQLALIGVLCPFDEDTVADIYFKTLRRETVKFYCCGLIYSTEDPETYWCIDTYKMKQPSLNIIGGKKVAKEMVYTLFCKKNGCTKVEIQRYYKENETLKILETRTLSKENAQKFLERTQDMRIRQPQCCPLRKIETAKNIPWVYGKAINSETQVARYMDESGNRNIFKDQIWQAEIMKSTVKTSKL